MVGRRGDYPARPRFFGDLMASTSELISSLQTQIAAVLANPGKYISYTVGDKKFDRGQYLDFLKTSLKTLQEINANEVDLDFVQFDFDIVLNGDDQTQFTVL